MFLFLEQFYVLCIKSYVIKMLEFFQPSDFYGQSGLSTFLLTGALFYLAPLNRTSCCGHPRPPPPRPFYPFPHTPELLCETAVS